MRIGVAREIKQREYRVALTPAGALELVRRGHEVLDRAGRRRRVGLRRRGLRRRRRADRVRRGRLGLGRAAAQGEGADRGGVRPAAGGADALHVPAHRRGRAADARARRLGDHRRSPTRRSRSADRQLPLLAPMSEVAGRLAPQMGAWSLEKAHGGRGILLGGVPGVPPAKVVILGGGVVGLNAAIIALGMQADVWVLDKSVERMRDLEIALDGRVTLAMSNRLQIEEVLVGRRHGDRCRARPGRDRAEARDAGDARPDEAGRGARRRRDRPGRLLRDVARDDARRPGLRGRRDRPLLRREHARRRPGDRRRRR